MQKKIRKKGVEKNISQRNDGSKLPRARKEKTTTVPFFVELQTRLAKPVCPLMVASYAHI
jgi:hypothetical protein